jgi:hypothetical protein
MNAKPQAAVSGEISAVSVIVKFTTVFAGFRGKGCASS